MGTDLYLEGGDVSPERDSSSKFDTSRGDEDQLGGGRATSEVIRRGVKKRAITAPRGDGSRRGDGMGAVCGCKGVRMPVQVENVGDQ